MRQQPGFMKGPVGGLPTRAREFSGPLSSWRRPKVHGLFTQTQEYFILQVCTLTVDNELISNVKRKYGLEIEIEFCSTDSILECRKRVSLALEQTDYASEADDQDMRPKRKLKYDFYAFSF